MPFGPAETLNFGEEFRPVQLAKVVLGVSKNTENEFKFDASLNYK